MIFLTTDFLFLYLVAVLILLIYIACVLNIFKKGTKSVFKAVEFTHSKSVIFNLKLLLLITAFALLIDTKKSFGLLLIELSIYVIIFIFVNNIIIYFVLFKLLTDTKNNKYADYLKFYRKLTNLYYILNTYIDSQDVKTELLKNKEKLLIILKYGFVNDIQYVYNAEINTELDSLILESDGDVNNFILKLDNLLSKIV